MGPYKNQLGTILPTSVKTDRVGTGPAADGQLLNLADLPSQPWKNGGGITTEIAIGPVGATLQDFRWRISRAQIEREGPFSVFPGVTRWIALMEGAGCRLDLSDGSGFELVPHRAFVFSGDLSAICRLNQNRPCTVINVMAKHDMVMRVNVARSTAPMPSLGHAVVSTTGAAVRLDAKYVLTADADQ
jgi:environmental stress-induced protein Ves